ncbi:hypothetical protein AGMMS49992_10980 [Clostridia bacterium]|nr:hypothetical protein AGMMS49992_10980 [Clostridia bacterium]
MGIQYLQPRADSGEKIHPKPLETLAPDAGFDVSCEMRLLQDGYAGICFGLDAEGSGYALLVNHATQAVHFMRSDRGALLRDCGMRRSEFALDTWIPMRVTYDGRIIRAWFNANPLDKNPWPKYEFALELQCQRIALDTGHGTAEFRSIETRPLKVSNGYAGETFVNPVLPGADPDILLYNGTYYIYNRVPNDPASSEDAYLIAGDARAKHDQAGDADTIFRAASSEDLVHWSAYTPVFQRDEALAGMFCMSPNVIHKDGLFYLFFAAGRPGGGESFHIYTAVADSPRGPFRMRSKTPLHTDTQEIGGMPFMDEDGECYISYVRFNCGNFIWLQHIRLDNGQVIPDDATLVHLISPEEDYEADEYGRIAEGAVLTKHNGWYYMIYATGHYKGHYGEAYAVSRNIYGPYAKAKENPFLHHHFQVDGCGDGVFVYSKDRSRVALAYHRHISAQEIEPRMTCIDRLKFVPNPNGGPDLLTVYGPTSTPQPIPFSDEWNS